MIHKHELKFSFCIIIIDCNTFLKSKRNIRDVTVESNADGEWAMHHLISVIKKSERISLKKNQTVSLPKNTLGVLEVGEVQFLTGNKNLKVTENTVLGLSNMSGNSLSWKEQTLKKSQVLCLLTKNLLQAPGVRWCLQRAYQNYHFHLSS